MRVRCAGFLLIMSSFFAGSADAQDNLFICNMTSGVRTDLALTDLYVFELSPDRKAAQVVDAVIKSMKNRPIAATVKEDTNTKLVLGWRLLFTVGGGNQVPMDYRLAMTKANGAVSVTNKAVGGDYYGGGDARGKCKPG